MFESSPVRFNRIYIDTIKNVCSSDSKIITSTNTSYGSNFRSGVVNPTFKAKIALGQTATTAFNGQFSNISARDGDIYRKAAGIACSASLKPVVENRRSGNIYTATAAAIAGTSLDQIADNEAIPRFLNKVQEAQSSFNGPVFLGELRETLHMIKRPLQSFRKGVDSYFSTLHRRVKRKYPRNTKLQILSDTWLETNFGWSQLMRDISDGVAAYDRIFDIGDIIYVTGAGSADRIVSNPTCTSSSMNGIIVLTTFKSTEETSIVYRGGVKQTAYGGSTARFAEVSGFRMDQFVPTVWELIPYSFIVDYFSNVGDIINASCFNSASLTWRCRTVQRAAKVYVSGRVDSASMQKSLSVNYRGSGGNPGSFAHQQKTVIRDAGGPGVPSLSFSIPGLSTKWLNLAALAGSHRRAKTLF